MLNVCEASIRLHAKFNNHILRYRSE